MIYIITDNKYIKVGKSNNPRKRLLNLQVANPNNLKFLFIFDINDKYEKFIHSLLKRNKTKANNEWFNIGYDELYNILKKRNNIFDVEKAIHKANLLNSTLYKNINNFNKLNKKNNIIEKSGNKLKEKIKYILNDIRYILENNKETIISYNQYIKDTGLTKEEISFYVKSAKLSKKVFDHNKKLFK